MKKEGMQARKTLSSENLASFFFLAERKTRTLLTFHCVSTARGQLKSTTLLRDASKHTHTHTSFRSTATQSQRRSRFIGIIHTGATLDELLCSHISLTRNIFKGDGGVKYIFHHFSCDSTKL